MRSDANNREGNRNVFEGPAQGAPACR
jgi:hypothetical protein